MNFSKMRQRITLLKPSGGSVNSLNETVPEYVTYKTVWANVSPMTGREYAESQKIRAETTYRVIIRYMSGVTSEMRVDYGGRKLEVVSVLNIDERNRQLQLICSEADCYGKGN